jgi:hypothetical protein
MTMKKKWLTMGAGLGIGAVMLLTSGLSAMANTSGYDVYKAAVKNNAALTSVSNTGSLTVTDNGAKVLSAGFQAKLNHEQNTMSAAMTVGNGTAAHEANVYKQADKIIFKSGESDVYRQLAVEGSKWKHDGAKSGPHKFAEPVIDALMGNLKEMATVEETADGGKVASLHLSGSQVPAVVNAVGSLAVSRLADCEQWNDGTGADPHGFSDIAAGIPQLTENIKVQQIHLDAEINADQYLEHQTGEIVITGTDASGLEHNLVITLDFNLSGFNETVPDTIDLTGKQVEVIQQTDHKGPPWHH